MGAVGVGSAATAAAERPYYGGKTKQKMEFQRKKEMTKKTETLSDDGYYYSPVYLALIVPYRFTMLLYAGKNRISVV
jgi:hypothetical protein